MKHKEEVIHFFTFPDASLVSQIYFFFPEQKPPFSTKITHCVLPRLDYKAGIFCASGCLCNCLTE